MFELYKLNNPIQPEYMNVEQAHVRYLFDLAIDRVDGCQIDGVDFVETPRVFGRKGNNASTQTVNVITINDDDKFQQGSILTYDNDYWLCLTCFEYHKLYLKGLFQRCNYKMRWQNKAGDIIERWACVQDASAYNSGTDGNKTLQIGADQVMVYIPCDEETVTMARDKRFMIDCNTEFPTTYTLTRIDTTGRTVDGVGYCIWLLTESQLNNQTDNIELMICDYFENEPLDIITYSGKPQVRSGGVAKKFTANTDELVVWSLILMAEQQDYITLTDIGNNQCSIKCKANNALIGTSFRLVAHCSGGEQDILIDIVGGV